MSIVQIEPIPPDDLMVSVVVVTLVGDEINLFEELPILISVLRHFKIMLQDVTYDS